MVVPLFAAHQLQIIGELLGGLGPPGSGCSGLMRFLPVCNQDDFGSEMIKNACDGRIHKIIRQRENFVNSSWF
jgi:hypothetical protein